MTPKSYTVIRFLMVNTKTKATCPNWVAAVSFADGPGYRVKSVTFTNDRAKAARFSSMTALEIAKQYFNRVITLESADGTPNVALTAELLKTQMTKQLNHRELTRKANEEMRAFWSELVAAVPSLAQFARVR